MSFLEQFEAGLAEDSGRYQLCNTDWVRHPKPWPRRVLRLARDAARWPLYAGGLRRARIPDGSEWLRLVRGQADRFQHTYDLLGDDRSRKLLLELLRYRVLGRKHVRLSRHDAAYRRHAASARSCRRSRQRDYDVYEVHESEGPVRLHSLRRLVQQTFFVRQYVYEPVDGPRIGPEPGDRVIDGGGYWGETALWLANRVGSAGQVYTFEFVEANLRMLEQNRARNGHLQPRIEIVPRALWNRSGETLRFETGLDAGTSVTSGRGDAEVETVTIDDFAAGTGNDRIDFVKLDVDRPRLAISAYHLPTDLITLPAWLDGLGLGYRFFLDHATIHAEETVLFATP
jgi:FkbM family methyltransferase